MPIRAPAMHPAAPLTNAAVMIEATRPNVMASPLEGLLAIRAMLAPIGIVERPLSTPLMPPIAAPVCFPMVCLITADESQRGHFLICEALIYRS